MKRLALVASLVVALAACSKKKEGDTGGGMASGSAATMDNGSAAMGSGSSMAAGSGSSMAAGSGSSMAAGSGSSMAAGSGSDSGSAAAGSGSAVAMGSGSGSAAGSAAGSGSGSAGDSAWSKLSHEEKAEFMKKNVVPAMKVEFQKFDGKKYAEFGCKTCHGKDPRATKFKMPSPDLPKLDFAALQAGKQKPEVAKFMGEVVKPQMAKILGEKEFDMKHPEAGGFGCLECHEQKK
jgi:hypothetical protein